MDEEYQHQGTEPLNYWFDGQLRRISMQVMRVFSHIHYATGYQKDGKLILRRVPIRYAITNRQVAHILKNSSENIIFTVPMMTIFLSSIEYARDRLQEPFHVDKIQIYERDYDEEQQSYGKTIGGRYTLERLMPVPYNLKYQLDIWTSNQLQKDQIVEQIVVLFNPGIQLQSSNNVFDWTALSELTLDEVVWSSRGINIGTSDEIEITSFIFSLQTWISPPAIIHKQKLINTIVSDIIDDVNFLRESEERGLQVYISETDMISRVVVTPGNHNLLVEGNKLTLLGEKNNLTDVNGKIFSWGELIDKYGKFRPGISAVMINTSDNIENWENAVRGTIEFTDQENILIWSIDPLTLPVNNLPSIKAIINPKKVWPGNGIGMVSPGDRYLITEDISSSSLWGNLSAKKNSIIEYDGTKWNVLFNSEFQRTQSDVYYVLNEYNNKQLKWDKNGWSYSIDGVYNRGYWRLLL